MHLRTPRDRLQTILGLSIVPLTVIWLTVFLLTALYCYSHGVMLRHPLTSLSHSILWAVSVWLPWVLLWPGIRRWRASYNVFLCIGLLSAAALAGKILLSLLLLPDNDIALMVFRYLPFEVLVAWLLLLWLGRASTVSKPTDVASIEPPCIDAAGDLPVSPDVVLWVSAARNYVELFTHDRSHLMRTTLTELSETLRPHGFVRTHRSHMVNARALSHLKKVGSRRYQAVLLNGASVPISMKHIHEVSRLTSTR